MEAPGAGHPLDRPDLGLLALDGEGEAREHRLAVEEHGAGPALAELAAVLGPGQPEVLAQHLEQGLVDRDRDLVGLAVHPESQKGPHRHPRASSSGTMKSS